jgi:hypothetical protein
VIAIGFLILGLVLMLIRWRVSPGFFKRRPKSATPRCRQPL